METAQYFSISDRLVTNDRKNLDFRVFGTIKEIIKIELKKITKPLKTQCFQGFSLCLHFLQKLLKTGQNPLVSNRLVTS